MQCLTPAGSLKLLDPGAEITFEELNGLRVLCVAAEWMHAKCSTAQGVVTDGASAYCNKTDCQAAEGQQ